MFDQTRVADLKPGDLVDLEHDRYADPPGSDSLFEFEYAEVEHVERETRGCVRVDFDSTSVGFPPYHCLRRAV